MLLSTVLMEELFIDYVVVYSIYVVINYVYDIVRGWEGDDIFISSPRGW